ncbi:MAG TPA: hypothetical protein PKC22_15570, partial [Rhodocyclaceae bacterium]|nr:hypothetical protein [Rhodocyclaceae bacterium]
TCIVGAAISGGMRFYLPDARHVLDQREISNRLAYDAQLPCDPTVVLSESFVHEGSRRYATWKCSVAFDPSGPFAAKYNFCSPDLPRKLDDGRSRVIALLSAYRVVGPDASLGFSWMATPGAALVQIRPDGPAVVYGYPVRGADSLDIPAELADDLASVANLCALLALKNVGYKAAGVPERLAKAREKRGGSPLFSYHILDVDGETWDRHAGDASRGNPVRSHLRRGHIRRLHDGRHVWVRHTIVHGKRPGYVDKDYDLTKLARPAQ